VPGHNGLINLTLKRLKIQKLHNEIENLKIKIELVRAKIDKTNDPEYIKRYAYDRYGMVPRTDTLNIKTQQSP
jgi:cell division protein FtsB